MRGRRSASSDGNRRPSSRTSRKSWSKRTSRASADPANRNDPLRPGWRREARRAVGADVPNAFVVLTEWGLDLGPGKDLVKVRNRGREGNPVAVLFGRLMHFRF